MFAALNPYSLFIKIGCGVVALLALLALLWSWHSRGQEIDALHSWRQTVVLAATNATVVPDAKGKRKALAPEQVPDAIAGLKRSLDGANGAIEHANEMVTDARARSEQDDIALRAQEVEFNRRYAAANNRITALEHRKPAATSAEGCDDIDADSKAAWEGWH